MLPEIERGVQFFFFFFFPSSDQHFKMFAVVLCNVVTRTEIAWQIVLWDMEK